MREGKNNPNYKHGMKGTKIYNIYFAIKQRCNNLDNKDYHRYGGRGIDCEWKNFEDFFNDMKHNYKEGLEIDRIDNNGNYSKSNCRWATRKQQNRNSSNCRMYKGKCISQWCEELGLNYSTVRSRINQSKWTIKKALELG